MNKQQIIAPLVAMFVVAMIFMVPKALIMGRKNANYYTRARSEEIGRALIRETNSVFLTEVGTNLNTKLSTFLDSPAKVEKVTIGDAEAPVGDGTAHSQIWLVNQRQDRIVIRLRKESEPEKFSVIGFWSPLTNSNKPQGIRSENQPP